MQRDIYRTQLVITKDKETLATQKALFWALSILKQPSFLASKPKALIKKTTFQEDRIIVNARLFDLQSRFNLNNLRNKQNMEGFTRLLTAVPKPPTLQSAKEISSNTYQWLLPYSTSQGQDALTNYYLHQNPPYHPSRLLFQSISEWRLVKGVSAELYEQMSPFLAALPDITPININTASPMVLMALGLNKSQVEKIIETKGTEGFKNPVLLSALLASFNLNSAAITLKSEYFLVESQIESGELHLRAYFMLRRIQDKKNQVQIQLINHSVGGL
jgi:general secretion pathway protein K